MQSGRTHCVCMYTHAYVHTHTCTHTHTHMHTHTRAHKIHTLHICTRALQQQQQTGPQTGQTSTLVGSGSRVKTTKLPPSQVIIASASHASPDVLPQRKRHYLRWIATVNASAVFFVDCLFAFFRTRFWVVARVPKENSHHRSVVLPTKPRAHACQVFTFCPLRHEPCSNTCLHI
jgi:hypothetical protein